MNRYICLKYLEFHRRPRVQNLRLLVHKQPEISWETIRKLQFPKDATGIQLPPPSLFCLFCSACLQLPFSTYTSWPREGFGLDTNLSTRNYNRNRPRFSIVRIEF